MTGKMATARVDEAPAAYDERSDVSPNAFYLLSACWILSGALRKWIVPGAERLLFFVPDVVLVGAYIQALRVRRPLRGTWVAFCVVLLSVALIFTSVQVMIGNQNVAAGLYGLSEYILPVALPLAACRLLDVEDVRKLETGILAVAPAMAILSVVQTLSPAQSFVNRLFAIDGSDNLGTTNGVVRATTTFTASAGNTAFVDLCIAVLVVRLAENPKDRLGRISILPILVLLFTSGSRSAIFAVIPILVVTLYSLSAVGRSVARFVLGFALSLTVGFLITKEVAPEVLNSFIQRFQTAASTSQNSSRILSGFSSFVKALTVAPSFGTGLGTLSQGAVAATTGGFSIEDELSRWVFELGAVIFPFVLSLRWGFAVALAVRVLRQPKQSRLPCLVYLATVFPTLVTGQITAQGSLTLFVWLTISLIVVRLKKVPDLISPTLSIL